MALDGPSYRVVLLSALIALAALHVPAAHGQNKQGLGPGGTRLTKPDAPSSGTGFGPNTGFGSTSSGSSGSDPSGTRCVSIQCADGTVVPCNSSCPRPSSPAPSSGGPSYGTPQYGTGSSGTSRAEEERRRRDEQARQAEAEAKRRAEFAKGRDEALRALKGGPSAGIALKGAEQEGGLPLKDLESATVRDAPATKAIAKADACAAATDPSTVNLCHLNAGKPIVVDIDTAKGRRKVSISPGTLHNPDYEQGFKAIVDKDYVAAVQHFKSAQKRLGDDLFVRNGLALATDLLRVEQRKQRVDNARRAFNQGMNLAFRGDYANAIRDLKSAVAFDPSNPRYRDELAFVQGVSAGAARESDAAKQALADKAFELVGQSMVAIARSDWDSAVIILRAALVVNPGDEAIAGWLDLARAAQKTQRERAHQQTANAKGKP